MLGGFRAHLTPRRGRRPYPGRRGCHGTADTGVGFIARLALPYKINPRHKHSPPPPFPPLLCRPFIRARRAVGRLRPMTITDETNCPHPRSTPSRTNGHSPKPKATRKENNGGKKAHALPRPPHLRGRVWRRHSLARICRQHTGCADTALGPAQGKGERQPVCSPRMDVRTRLQRL